ncbi:hypothetical protein BpHYR1_048150 [Brachionus plicatilis]|uniref:Uncharacterized protein n=1 Tax=Brachionus plicatilis TaxID=10195 RepID=A0A3M7T0H9_BRAPC|nr:hypothetical protein BpHYR1_048150 [Brachionus plicatilis]
MILEISTIADIFFKLKVINSNAIDNNYKKKNYIIQRFLKADLFLTYDTDLKSTLSILRRNKIKNHKIIFSKGNIYEILQFQ